MSGKEKVELSAKALERQQKKIAKQLRKKQYSDIAIQGTNDYSIVSKRSVEKLYSSKINEQLYDCEIPQYFQNFVMKFQRRSPAINRGYWTRMEAIKQSSYKIIKDSVSKGKKVAIINLGAGYDPLAFQYLDPANPDNFDYKDMLSFVDVDYPDLNKIKIQMINNSKQLTAIIGEKQDSDFQGVDLKTKNYTALSCDLKNLDLFTKQLEYLNLSDENITKIYIAEVSIAYMSPQYADPVIKTTSKFPNSHFLLLEQLLPAGAYQGFARTMLFHFSKLNSPLNSVTTYPTIEKQLKRFFDSGYEKTVEALDLEAFWNTLPKTLRQNVNEVEAFDEWEEFILFAQHYLILHASNVDLKLFPKTIENNLENYKVEEGQLHLKPRSVNLERKFLAADVIVQEIIVNGGASTSRLNTTLSTSALSIKKHELPSRQAHTFTSTENGLLLVGGRSSPDRPLNDTWILSKSADQHEWRQLQDLPSARSRHATFKFGQEIYIYGGNHKESAFLGYLNGNWKDIKHTGSLESLNSAAVAVNGSIGVVVGGMDSEGAIQSSLYSFRLDGDVIKTELVLTDPLLNRYSAHAVFISPDELLIFGGVSDLLLFDQTTSIIRVNLKTKEITRIKIDDATWARFPLLVGFQLLKYKERLITIGGGAVCYSFGSIWNDVLIFGKDIEIPEFQMENVI
jgi:tRNA wybutosine-synthesizing protein 4